MPWLPVNVDDPDPHVARFTGDPAELVDALDDLLAAVKRPAWHARAACRGKGPQPWFPERGASLEPARSVCAHCPVTKQCLDAGLYERNGVWAGTSERERRSLRRQAA